MSDDDRITVEWSPDGRADRRLVFVPREDDYLRREQTKDHAGEWRDVGTEAVDSVSVHLPGE